MLEFKPKIVKKNWRKSLTGIAQYMDRLETGAPPNPPVNPETHTGVRKKAEIAGARAAAKEQAEKDKLLQKKKEYDATKAAEENPDKFTSNKYNTLFVARLSKDTTEESLRKLFAEFGDIEKIVMVKTPEGEFKGYAFVEFKNEQDMTQAYRKANGAKMGDNRILVDVERGRTVKGWYPRRLGGGLGGEARRDRGKGRAGGMGGRGNADSYRRENRDRDYRDRDYRDRDYRDRDRRDRGGFGGGRERDRDRGRFGGRDRGRDRDRGGYGGRERSYSGRQGREDYRRR